MNATVVEVAIGAVSVAAWAGLYAVMLLVTRPRSVAPAPATQDLGAEPPAVVSLVGQGWDLGEDAIEATLLDLGARKHIEFRQPANDPTHTTIHIRQPSPSGLSPYEQRVFDRVAGLAVGGVVPLTALTFRDPKKAKSWWKRVRSEIVADARSRGLSRRRFSPAIVGTLVAAAVAAALGVGAAVLIHETRVDGDDPLGDAGAGAFAAFIFLAFAAGRSVGERDTPAGREVAARWLGVRAWLQGNEGFADQPAAVAVWDRYLAYGAALGTTRVASAVIDLGMGNRKRVWSSYGGVWHRVRVRYPRLGFKWGATAPVLVFRALLALAAGYVLVRWWRALVGEVAAIEDVARSAVGPFLDLISLIGFLAGIALILYGLYAIVRVVIDLAAPVTVTGQVLWLQVWKQTQGSENSPPTPTLYYLAIDDGRAERTTAWALPAGLGDRCDTGDTVTMKIRRWPRRIIEITVIERGTAGHADGTEAVDTENMVSTALASTVGSMGGAMATAMRGPAVAAGSLLTTDEVSQALGLPVKLLDTPAIGPVGMTQFATTDRNRVVLMLQVADGMVGRMAWRSNTRGQQLPGIGAEAWTKDDRAVARIGDTVVLLILMRDGKGGRQQLRWLLQQAVARASGAKDTEPA
jgi:Predicted membrane protein (DUF2207)